MGIKHSHPVPPFMRYCSAIIPTMFDDSLSYYEALCALNRFIQKNLVEVINNNATVTQEYIDLTNQLKEYMENYFDNLDVQEEINNKLDAMVTDGTMNTIINQEIFGDINSRLNLLDNKKFVFVGDSYSVGWTPDGDVTGWPYIVKQYMGLTDEQVIYSLRGGYSFCWTNLWFSSLIDELDADSTVTDVVVCGGYNDIEGNYSKVEAGILAFRTSVYSKFPNARIHIGFIGNSNNVFEKNKIFNCRRWYYDGASTMGGNISYLNNVEYSLCNTYETMSSDGKHPNATGQQLIAKNITNALLTGSADVIFGSRDIGFELNTDIWSSSTNFQYISTRVTNGTTTIEVVKDNTGAINLNTSGYTLNCNGSNILVGNLSDGHIIGNGFNSVIIPVHCIVNYKVGNTDYFVEADGSLLIENKKLYIRLTKINDSLSNFATFSNVSQIQIPMFSQSFQTLFC